MRLSRRAILIVAGGATALVFCAVAFGMTYKPRQVEKAPELVAGGSPPEAIRLLPSDYRRPKLGEPLPGDLGRPTLAAAVAAEPASPRSQQAPTPANAAAVEADTARRSRLFLEHTGAARREAPDLPSPLTPPAAVPTGMQRATAGRLTGPASPYVVQAGAVIPAARMTGLRSDLPSRR